MRKIFAGLLALGLVAVPVAKATNIPYGPELDARLGLVENKRTARAVFNVADPEGSSTTRGGVAAHGLGVYLPANAVITRDYYHINTAFAGVTGHSVALHCETANNILSSANLGNYLAGSTVDAISTGASSVFKPITSPCELTATVATSPLTAGKLTLWVEYIVR